MTTITAGRRSEAAHAEKRTTDWRARYFNWFCAGVLLVFAAIWIIPLLWALDTSLKPDAVIAAQPPRWWSGSWTLHGYQLLFNLGNIQTWYLNSFVISLLSAVFAVLACSMAGFAIARTRFTGRRIVYGLIAAGLLIPPQVLIVPMFNEFNFAPARYLLGAGAARGRGADRGGHLRVLLQRHSGRAGPGGAGGRRQLVAHLPAHLHAAEQASD